MHNSWIVLIIQDDGIQGYDKQELDKLYLDGLVQERRNSIANALELRLSCTNPLIWMG